MSDDMKISVVVKSSTGAFIFGKMYGRGVSIPVKSVAQAATMLATMPDKLKVVSSNAMKEYSLDELRALAGAHQASIAEVINGPQTGLDPRDGVEGNQDNQEVEEPQSDEVQSGFKLMDGDSFPKKNSSLSACKAFAEAYGVDYQDDIKKDDLYDLLKEAFGIEG